MSINALADGRWAVLKTDTTGRRPGVDRVVDVAVVQYDGLVHVGEGRAVVNPGVPIPAVCTKMHGIDDVRVQNRPSLTEVAEKLVARLSGRIVVGFNVAKFDIPMLCGDLESQGWSRLATELRGLPVVDVMLMARYLDAKYRSHAMQAVFSRYGVGVQPGKGGVAMGKADAIWRAMVAMAGTHKHYFERSASELAALAGGLAGGRGARPADDGRTGAEWL